MFVRKVLPMFVHRLRKDGGKEGEGALVDEFLGGCGLREVEVECG